MELTNVFLIFLSVFAVTNALKCYDCKNDIAECYFDIKDEADRELVECEEENSTCYYAQVYKDDDYNDDVDVDDPTRKRSWVNRRGCGIHGFCAADEEDEYRLCCECLSTACNDDTLCADQTRSDGNIVAWAANVILFFLIAFFMN